MDFLFCCCSVYDSPPTRTTLLVSHLPSVSVHSIALTGPHFLVAFVRNPPTGLISSKFPWRISCQVIPTKQSRSKQQVQEERQQRHNAMKNFLLQECRFSSSEITLLTAKDPSLFRRKSLDRSHEVLQMLRDYGFTVGQVRKAIYRNPGILFYSVNDSLKPKIEYLKTLGIAEKDLSHIISKNPTILNPGLVRTIAPKMSSLIRVFGSKANLSKALRNAPQIASYKVDIVIHKLKILESAGLLEHEIKQILEKDPRFLCASVGKIEKNMKFLTCTAGFKPNVVVKYPVLLSLSIEKRTRPRYKVFQYLNLRARHDDSMCLLTSLTINEAYFTERFLSGSPEVKRLYEKYKGETAGVEVRELLPTPQR